MLEDYILLIELIVLCCIVYGVTSYVGDKLDSMRRKERLKRGYNYEKDI